MYASLPFQKGRSEVEASLPSFLSVMVSRKCQNHLNPQQRNLLETVVLSNHFISVINAYHIVILPIHQDKSLLQSRGQMEVKKFLDSQWREVAVQYGLPEEMQRHGGGSCLSLHSQAYLNYVKTSNYII